MDVTSISNQVCVPARHLGNPTTQGEFAATLDRVSGHDRPALGTSSEAEPAVHAHAKNGTTTEPDATEATDEAAIPDQAEALLAHMALVTTPVVPVEAPGLVSSPVGTDDIDAIISPSAALTGGSATSEALVSGAVAGATPPSEPLAPATTPTSTVSTSETTSAPTTASPNQAVSLEQTSPTAPVDAVAPLEGPSAASVSSTPASAPPQPLSSSSSVASAPLLPAVPAVSNAAGVAQTQLAVSSPQSDADTDDPTTGQVEGSNTSSTPLSGNPQRPTASTATTAQTSQTDAPAASHRSSAEGAALKGAALNEVWDVVKRASVASPRLIEATVATDHGMLSLTARHTNGTVHVALGGEASSALDLAGLQTDLSGSNIDVSVNVPQRRDDAPDQRTFTEPAKTARAVEAPIQTAQRTSSTTSQLDVLA